jgi:hypothetical protein
LSATLALRVVALWGNQRLMQIGVWSSWLLASSAMLGLMGYSLVGVVRESRLCCPELL